MDYYRILILLSFKKKVKRRDIPVLHLFTCLHIPAARDQATKVFDLLPASMPTGDSDLKSSAASAGAGGGWKQQQLRKSRTISGDSQIVTSSASAAAFQSPPSPAFRRASSGPLPPPAAGPVRRLAVAVDNPSDAPVFQGPLFPAVRRASNGSLPPPPAGPARRLMVAVDDPSDAPANGGVLDRDWFYPSFLGPYPSRPRASARARPKPDPPKAEHLPPPKLPVTDRTLEANKRISEPELTQFDKDALKLLTEREKRKLMVVPCASAVVSRAAPRTSHLVTSFSGS